jgi:hypothetical protein
VRFECAYRPSKSDSSEKKVENERNNVFNCYCFTFVWVPAHLEADGALAWARVVAYLWQGMATFRTSLWEGLYSYSGASLPMDCALWNAMFILAFLLTVDKTVDKGLVQKLLLMSFIPKIKMVISNINHLLIPGLE